jgi:Holliday junction resolvasome RuvABC DNA-binding subunit
MIASVEGEVVGLGESFLVVRVGGVGLQVYAPLPFRARQRMMDRVFCTPI